MTFNVRVYMLEDNILYTNIKYWSLSKTDKFVIFTGEKKTTVLETEDIIRFEIEKQ